MAPRALTALVAVLLLLAGCAAPRAGPGDGTTPPAPPPAIAPTPPGVPPPARLEELRIALQEPLHGFDQPVFLTHAGDGSGRVFVVEQGGLVKVVQGGRVLPEAFLDLRGSIAAGGERGLLSIAFDPHFKENGRMVAYYTAPNGDVVLARFLVRPGPPAHADEASLEELLRIDHHEYSNHNGGSLVFGPDGMLYAGIGDGGGGGDPFGSGQSRDALLGKVLRLDVSGTKGYASPADNPFVGKDGRDEVWAWGLRNPWRISFDRATGDLYLADVGQNQVEEVDFAAAGSKGDVNYGWNIWEGSQRFRSGEPASVVVFPVAEYHHDGGHCSVTGGYVYRGSAVPALRGTYLYADYCSGVVWGLRSQDGAWVSRQLLDTNLQISSFGEDEQGELYVLDHQGAVYSVGLV